MTGRRDSPEPSGPTPAQKDQSLIGAIQEQFRLVARKLLGQPEEPKPKPRRRGEGTAACFAATVRAVCRRGMRAAYHRIQAWDLSAWHQVWEYNEFSGLDFDCDYGYSNAPTSSLHPGP